MTVPNPEMIKINNDLLATIYRDKDGKIVRHYTQTRADIEKQLASIPGQIVAQKAQVDTQAAKIKTTLEERLAFLNA